MFYSSLVACIQLDLKKIIAYASISHMNLVIFSMTTMTVYGLTGAIVIMLAHGLTSAGLFGLIGSLYYRYKTRFISVYGGLSIVMPVFSVFLFFFLFANISLPGTAGFNGELIAFCSLAERQL
jgi:NADH:ubiquinone oxidoreductase subunit 4 (subunit M)